jgi:DNA-binding GntR family transcriptional regulator
MNGAAARNLSNRLVEQVRDRVLSGQVPPGFPIRQDVLASELGVSKIPLREALAKLEQDGLLRSEANRGFFVRPLLHEEAEEVYALRLKLEPELVALAAERATADEQELAAQALDALEQATSTHGADVGALNRAFHLALIRPAGQDITAGILERLHILSERYVRKHLEPHGRDVRANDEHRNLLECWQARQGEDAAQLVRIHIGRTLDDLREQLTGGE